ncbi:MAG: hypothetical protein UX98_C0002G0013 [Parcubacteria group bacterium GW2011_GWA2_47_26]|nr:MAG: hypothetical protein UX98_C0002G0013 [Parcubacteria group bacterium GW2011_GWA2_47_26]
MHLVTYTDGGARGNPGPAGIGVVIYKLKSGKPDGDLELVEKWGKYIGETTNNQAEYKALLAAIERAHKLGAEFLDCFLDSELVVRQLNREYKVRDAGLAPFFVKVWNETTHFKKVRFLHIPREKNKEADQLVNEAIDKAV